MVMAPKLAYSTESWREERSPRVSTRFAPETEDGLNPRRETKIQSKGGDRERKLIEKTTERRKLLARKRRRRGRAERRLLQQSETRNRARTRGRIITVATHNVRTMAVDGTHGVGQTLDDLSVCDPVGATSSAYRRRAAADTQPPARLVTSCTVAVSAVVEMVGRKDKVE